MLGRYLYREGLSQRSAARYLEVNESTVARIVFGSRNPPSDDRQFYENLATIPGLNRAEVGELLKARLPVLGLTKTELATLEDRYRGRFPPPTKGRLTTITTPQGFEFNLRVINNAAGLSDEDLEVLGDVIRIEAEMVLRQEEFNK